MRRLMISFALVVPLLFAAVCLAQGTGAPAPPAVAAAPAPKVDSGDTSWVLISSALVLLMTAPGLALFYGGMVRRKNVLATLMQSFILICVISVQWVLYGYSLSFGPDKWHLIGGLEWLGLRNVGLEPNADYAATIPHQAYMIFQMMFAIITPALITGAFAERMKFSAFLVFSLLWATVVYDPVCHWVWGINGWIRNLGALDFAGGTVVHINAGISALAAALYMGKRRGLDTEAMPPHDLTMTVLGAALLWFGWFGFNAGSAVAANGLAVSAFIATNTATATAALAWMFVEWIWRGKPTVLGAASGAVAGLVAITPASGFVDPSSAIVIGFLAGAVCYGAILLRERMKVDDALDVWAVHGVGGTLGILLTGVFAVTAVNVAGRGLVDGNAGQVGTQLVAIAATWIYSGVATLVILKVVDALVGLRVDEAEEEAGLDASQHGEVAWQS